MANNNQILKLKFKKNSSSVSVVRYFNRPKGQVQKRFLCLYVNQISILLQPEAVESELNKNKCK